MQKELSGAGSGGVLLPASEAGASASGGMSASLLRYLEELRRRLLRIGAAIAAGSLLSYFYIDDIMHYLTLPAGKLYYIQPAEAFFIYLKAAVFAGFLLTVPIVFYQLCRVFLPALTLQERKLLVMVVPSSILLFYAGLLFAFFFVLPSGIRFFLGFGNAELQPLLSIDKYCSFVLAFVLPFGAIFELPLVIIMLAKMGVVSSRFLKKQQRMVIFLTFVAGAVISPTPDVFSQSMIAVPMILLYEISWGIVRFVMKK